MKVRVKILFFAKARELAGKRSDSLDVPSSITYNELLNIIAATYSLTDIKNSIILSINEEFCGRESELRLQPDDEIGVIPPLSEDQLSLEEIYSLVAAESCGAVSFFVGTTRDNFEGRPVLSLEYEAYESMGLKCFENICNDARKQWQSIGNIAIFHRLGVVPVKEASIIVAISSPHRNDSIKATEWCINTIKSSAPIWKKEVYAEDKAEWKENKECAWSSSHTPIG